MDEREFLAERFESHRERLRAVAYRMLGSLTDAEDAVQESWLRLARTDADGVANLGAWLTTVVSRVCLDMLKSRKVRHEESLDTHVPDPIVAAADPDPAEEAVLADSVGLALLVVLETLTPAERLSFVLHDMFGVPFDQIAPIVRRSTANATQLASRARRRVPFHDRIRHVRAQRLLAADLAGAQHVQAHPGHDGGKPRAQVPDAAGVRPGQAQPGLLHRVVGLVQ